MIAETLDQVIIRRSLVANPHRSFYPFRWGDPSVDCAHILDGCNLISGIDDAVLGGIPSYIPKPDFLGNIPEQQERNWFFQQLDVVPVILPGVRHCFNVMEQLHGFNAIHITWDFYERYLPRAVPVLMDFIKNSVGDFMPIEQGYVYVMEPVQAGFSVVKIGKSISPGERLKKVSPKMPFECEFKEVYPSYFMSLAEKLVHKKFDHLRVNGEWFTFAPELEEWMQAEMSSFVRLAWISQLKEELWRLPEVRIASIFEPRIAFDPCVTDWGAIKDLERLIPDVELPHAQWGY